MSAAKQSTLSAIKARCIEIGTRKAIQKIKAIQRKLKALGDEPSPDRFWIYLGDLAELARGLGFPHPPIRVDREPVNVGGQYVADVSLTLCFPASRPDPARLWCRCWVDRPVAEPDYVNRETAAGGFETVENPRRGQKMIERAIVADVISADAKAGIMWAVGDCLAAWVEFINDLMADLAEETTATTQRMAGGKGGAGSARRAGDEESGKPDPIAVAITMKAKNPEMSVRAISKSVGIPKSTLAENLLWRQSVENIKKHRRLGRVMRGSKTQVGDIEAVDDREDEDDGE